MNDALPYWNHNTAYYPWIRAKTASCASVLDAGCGDGTLAAYLDDGTKEILGLDTDGDCIRRASAGTVSGHVSFRQADFLTCPLTRKFDAVVFSTSIHHMDMERALKRAADLLNDGGLLLIVGLAQPSSLTDYLAEALRVLPVAAISRLRHMRSSEENGVAVCYRYPTMGEVRRLVKSLLPGAVLRYGLYYRYLLEWRK